MPSYGGVARACAVGVWIDLVNDLGFPAIEAGRHVGRAEAFFNDCPVCSDLHHGRIALGRAAAGRHGNGTTAKGKQEQTGKNGVAHINLRMVGDSFFNT